MCGASLTQYEQQFLGSSQSEDGDQTAAFPVHNVVDRITEPSLPLLSLLVDVSPIGGLLKGGGSRVAKFGLILMHPQATAIFCFFKWLDLGSLLYSQ